MSGEFDPTNELGLFPDKLMICGTRGFLVKNDSLRSVCRRFIPDGDHFLDVLERYDMLITYVLGREEAVAGNAMRWALPFLKAYGATDHSVCECAAESMELMPGAEHTMGFVSRLMPTYINSASMEQAMIPLMDAIDAPLTETMCSETELDQCCFGRVASKNLRELCEEINALEVPDRFYALNKETTIDPLDQRIAKTLDEALTDRTRGPAEAMMSQCTILDSSRKAYKMLDIRRSTQIDLDGTIYIAGDHSDYQALNVVMENGGLPVSFNGSEYAVRGSRVAVISETSTVGAVLTQLFYDMGLQAVLDLAGDWSEEALLEANFSDRRLVDELLEEKGFPEVVAVDRDNVEDIAERSDRVHKAMLKKRSVLQPGFEPG